MPTYPTFKGNCPANVRKDAKYTVRTGKSGPVIALVYEAEDDERWHPTTDSHPELVKMVNDVKIAHGGSPNGSFYINEYKQVIVPVIGADEYYLAGTYEKPLRFDFEGKTISGEALDLEAHPISPGDQWVGPRAGIPYILEAGGNDIRYEYSPRPNVTKRVKLSKKIGAANANKAAAVIREVRGFAGGRFYVNEFGCIFSNVESDNGWECLYIGKIDLECWFPTPSS
ncbi:MAG: hypothetical protein KDN20_25150 [Verrucomicrobiae bacterium]|nr:hypothetical protein [Verrucomicrobiae bacterium]